MLSQFLANGIVSGSGYALIAFGFALIYISTKTFHFAHGAIYTLSAYLAYTFYNLLKFPLFVSFFLALLISSISGIILDEILYIPLVRRKSSSLIQMLSSLAAYIVIINVIAMTYGNETKVLSSGIQPTISFGGIILTRMQIILLASSIFCLFMTVFFLRKTKWGILIRAMRDNPTLLQILGIKPKIVRWIVFGLGSALTSVASMLYGFDVGIDPNIGMPMLLNGAVSVIIGGIMVFEGSIFGAFSLGLIQSLVIWKTSAQWQDTITFIILILFLIFRPQGIFGKRMRTEEEKI